MATKVSPVEIRKEIPWGYSLSQKDETLSHGEDFPAHCSGARSSPSDNFGAPLTQVNRRQESNEATTRIARLKEQRNPDKRA